MFLWTLVRFLQRNVDIWPWPGRNYVIQVHRSVPGPSYTHQSIGTAELPYFWHFNHVFMTSGSISMAKCRYLTLTGTHLRHLTSWGYLGDDRDPYHRMRHDQLHTPRRLNFSIWSSTSFFMQKTSFFENTMTLLRHENVITSRHASFNLDQWIREGQIPHLRHLDQLSRPSGSNFRPDSS